ncbi:MAG: glycosyltransferase family 9 protein [Pseudomonadota bacterium]
MKILIIKLSAIGDVAHTLPALNILRKIHPNARIDWLVEEAASGLIIGHPAIDNVIISSRKTWINNINCGALTSTFKEAVGFISALRSTEYDIILDFQGLFKSGIMAALARGKRKIGYGKTREGSHYFLNERFYDYDIEQHAILRYINLLKTIGIDDIADEITFGIPVADSDRQALDSLLLQNGWTNGRDIIAINPMAKWKTKLWLPNRFAEVADQLTRRLQVSAVFTGGKVDRDTVDYIRSAMKEPAIDLTGKTSLRMLAALYQRAACLISTDTGPMHIAAALGTPVIALFGPTAPWRTGPFGLRHTVIRKAISCSPCFKKHCDNMICMQRIEVQDVVDSVMRIMEKALS